MADAVDPLAPQQIPTTDPYGDFFKTLQNAAAGSASGRKTAADLNVQREQLLNQQYAQGSTNALNQAKFGLEAPGQNAGNSVRGDILANAKDASFSGLPPWLQAQIPTTTGGLRPSMFSDNTRQLGTKMSADALAASKAGPMAINYPTAPTIQAIPDASLLESIAGSVGTGGSIANAALKALGGGGGSGGGSGGNIPLQSLFDLFKKNGNTIPTPETGTGVLQQPGPDGLGPGTGPTVPSGPEDPSVDPYGGMDPATYMELFGSQGPSVSGGPDTSVDPSSPAGGMTPDELAAYYAENGAQGYEPGDTDFWGS